MGRGFGRGAKAVAIVTHAQVKRSAKMPKGLRGSRKKKRRAFAAANDEQGQLEAAMGVGSKGGKPVKTETGILEGGRKTMAQEIASIQFQSFVNKRTKGFKQLRKQLMSAVKDVRRRHHLKAQKRNRNGITTKQFLAQQYEEAVGKTRKTGRHAREEEEESDDAEESAEEESE